MQSLIERQRRHSQGSESVEIIEVTPVTMRVSDAQQCR